MLQHRADLQQILVKAALDAGVVLQTNACVAKINPDFNAEVTLTDGRVVTGDVLVGADGINSCVRARMTQFFGVEDRSVSTGDSAYRFIIPRSLLLDSPEILLPLDQRMNTRWIGPHGHIMAYPLRGNELYNVVMVHTTSSVSHDETDLWARKGSLSDLMNCFGSWSPMVRRLAACIDSSTLMQWPLNKRPNLQSWSVNCTTLLGDACHAMLPYVAQGAAQAIEDAAVLATCLKHIRDIPHALSVYESLRKPRAEFIQGCAEDMRRVLHLVDGPDQEERDRIMRAERVDGWKHPDLWADPEFQDIVWGCDVVEAAEKRCRAIGKTTLEGKVVTSTSEEVEVHMKSDVMEGGEQRLRILTCLAGVGLLALFALWN